MKNPDDILKLDESSWVEIYRNWLPNSEFFFEQLLHENEWDEVLLPGGKKPYYSKWYGIGWESIDKYQKLALTTPVRGSYLYMTQRLQDTLGVTTNSIQSRLYKNADDGTLWHSDLDHKVDMSEEVVCLSLGAPRRIAFRPRKGMPIGDPHVPLDANGHPVIHYNSGDMIITRGKTQSDWQHCVPLELSSAPRICLVFRNYVFEEKVDA